MSIESWIRAGGKASTTFISSLFQSEAKDLNDRSLMCYHLFSLLRITFENNNSPKDSLITLTPVYRSLNLDSHSSQMAQKALSETSCNFELHLNAITWIRQVPDLKRQCFELIFNTATEKTPMSHQQDAWILQYMQAVQLQSSEYLKMRRQLITSMTPHYSKLELNPPCSDADIKNNYRRLCQQYHPDKGGDHNLFYDIQKAYESLNQARMLYRELKNNCDELHF